MQLVGLCGPARSGKDTAAQILEQEFNYKRYAFADPVKKAAQAMFGLTYEQTWNDDFKDQVNPFWNITHREMFQKLGTEGGRDMFATDIWIQRARKEIVDMPIERNIVISDVRFQNEADWIQQSNGVVIKIERSDDYTIPASNHASELSLDNVEHDFLITNNIISDEFSEEVSLERFRFDFVQRFREIREQFDDAQVI